MWRLRSGCDEHEPSSVTDWLWSQVSVQSQTCACGGIVVTPFDRMRMSQPVANAPLPLLSAPELALLSSLHRPLAAWRRTRFVARPYLVGPIGV